MLDCNARKKLRIPYDFLTMLVGFYFPGKTEEGNCVVVSAKRICLSDVIVLNKPARCPVSVVTPDH